MLLNLCMMHLTSSPQVADAVEGGWGMKHLLRWEIEVAAVGKERNLDGGEV